MYKVELYVRVRRACMVDGMSTREAARVFGLHRDTVRKMLAYSVPPGYRRQTPPRRPKLEPYTGIIGAILEGDLGVPRKQRHTAKRIFERLRDVSRAARRWTTTAEESCTTGTMRDDTGLNWEPGGVRSGAGVPSSGVSQESSRSSEIGEAAFSRLCRRR